MFCQLGNALYTFKILLCGLYKSVHWRSVSQSILSNLAFNVSHVQAPVIIHYHPSIPNAFHQSFDNMQLQDVTGIIAT